MATLQPVLPANEARANFYQILDEAGTSLRQFTITHRGKPFVVIMSQEEFDGWQETLEILADKQLMASLRRTMKSKKIFTQEQADKRIGW
jgi:antitoxin YefM